MKLQPSLANLYARAAELLAADHKICLGTVLQAKGSTPQVPGASAIFTSEGLLAGTLGGGILEKDAEEKAVVALESRRSQLYSFELEADMNSPEGAICGGEVLILLDAAPGKNKDAFVDLMRSQSKRHAGLLTTRIRQIADQIEVERRWTEGGLTRLEQDESLLFPDQISADELMKREPHLLVSKRDNRPDTDGRPLPSANGQEWLFLEPVFPLPQLVIAGAGHIGQAVAHLGFRLDFEVTVIDDRPEFANRESLPEAKDIVVADIGEALSEFPLSSDSYVVIVTRGHQNDGDALRACIKSDVAYIGMIGSRIKIALMRKQFLEKEWATQEEWDQIHTPIGLDIQSKTVEEIAVSIAAQLVLERSRHQV
jgi:xanthine dehydrogenase accessory factor